MSEASQVILAARLSAELISVFHDEKTRMNGDADFGTVSDQTGAAQQPIDPLEHLSVTIRECEFKP